MNEGARQRSGLIPGIYNYCDRWCERCPFTRQCLQFRLERGAGRERSALQAFDALDSSFWQEIGEAIERASGLALQAAEGGDDLPAERPVTPFQPTVPALRFSAREHPVARAALAYAGMADQLLDEFDADGFGRDEEQEAVLVVRHYRYFIYPKIVRSIDARTHRHPAEDDHALRDADGSAKVALIAIDRSLAAWGILYGCRHEAEDAMLGILLHLDRLRRSLEVVFPRARAFVRPGLDE